MNEAQQIADLERQIKDAKSRMDSCKHEWQESKFDPESHMVSDNRKGYEHHGSDMWPVPSYHEEFRNRWSRECSKCGKKEYTYENETVSVITKPKFR